MELDKDWIQDVYVCKTLGGDIQVRLDGSSINEDHNRYGGKGRHHFMIGEGFKTKQEARTYAIDWLKSQIAKLEANHDN